MADTLSSASVTAYAARSVTPVHTLSGETLRRLSSQSIADALRYFSGVQIKDYGGIGGLKTVNVRSLGAQHTSVFINGINITNAQNGQVDLGRYSLDNVEEISLYNAQKSESLQSAAEYASASSVYLRTRRPAFDGKDYNLMARFKGGSFGSLNPSMRYERKIGKVALSAEGMYLRTRGDYRFTIKNDLEDTTARRANGDVTAARAEMGLWAQPWGGNLQAHLYYYDSERGLPGPVIRRLSDQYAATDRQWDRNMFIQVSYSKSLPRWSFLVNAKGARDFLEYQSDPEKNSAAVYVHNQYIQKDFYGSVSAAWHPANWVSMNLAFDERWSDLNCDVPYYNYVQRFDTKIAAAASFVLGGFTLQSSVLWTMIQDITKGTPAPLNKTTPTMVLGWHDPKGRLSLRAFHKSSYRAPTLNDLYYTMIGNASLRPEHARQWDLGFDVTPSGNGTFKTTLSADAFINRVTDKIVAMPVRSQFRWSMVNFGRVEGMGAEIRSGNSLKLRKATFTALLNYSWEKAVDKTDPTSIGYGGQIPYTPWHSGSAVAGIDHGPWKANLSFLYTGVRYRASDNIEQNRLSPFMTTDLSISRDFRTMGGSILNLGLDVNNILNQQYEVVSRYPMPGTNVMIKITINI